MADHYLLIGARGTTVGEGGLPEVEVEGGEVMMIGIEGAHGVVGIGVEGERIRTIGIEGAHGVVVIGIEGERIMMIGIEGAHGVVVIGIEGAHGVPIAPSVAVRVEEVHGVGVEAEVEGLGVK